MFDRPKRHFRQIQLTSLIDIMVLLVIFFMLTSSFIKSESIELSIPKVSEKQKKNENIIKVFVSDNGDITLGNRPVNVGELFRSLKEIFKTKPDQRVLVLSAPKITVQNIVSVMDVVYQSGGRNMSVMDWAQVGYTRQWDKPHD